MPSVFPDPAAVGARIKQARREAGLSQDALAARAGFSTRSLSDYERGLLVPYEHLATLELLVGRTREWLLYGEDGDEATERRLRRLETLMRDRLAAHEEMISGMQDQLDGNHRRLERLEQRERPAARRRPGNGVGS